MSEKREYAVGIKSLICFMLMQKVEMKQSK